MTDVPFLRSEPDSIDTRIVLLRCTVEDPDTGQAIYELEAPCVQRGSIRSARRVDGPPTMSIAFVPIPDVDSADGRLYTVRDLTLRKDATDG